MNSFFLVDITNDEFKLISEIVYINSGISLNSNRKDLVQSRLQKKLKDLNLNSFTDYISLIKQDITGNELKKLITLISTNHTYFNREKHHFEFLMSTALPEITEYLKYQNSNDLRIWSAGCSSGEEAYNLSILLFEFFEQKYYLWKSGVLATDISSKALEIAKEGLYSEENIKKLPFSYLKYFNKVGNNYKVIDKVKKEITFRNFNLINSSFNFKSPFHIIFCRNVMIYFDEKTRNDLYIKFRKSMVDGAYLFIGHSETIPKNNFFRPVKPSIYQAY